MPSISPTLDRPTAPAAYIDIPAQRLHHKAKALLRALDFDPKTTASILADFLSDDKLCIPALAEWYVMIKPDLEAAAAIAAGDFKKAREINDQMLAYESKPCDARFEELVALAEEVSAVYASHLSNPFYPDVDYRWIEYIDEAHYLFCDLIEKDAELRRKNASIGKMQKYVPEDRDTLRDNMHRHSGDVCSNILEFYLELEIRSPAIPLLVDLLGEQAKNAYFVG